MSATMAVVEPANGLDRPLIGACPQQQRIRVRGEAVDDRDQPIAGVQAGTV